MYDPQIHSVQVPADIVFEQLLVKLSSDLRSIIERASANGSQSLQGPAISEMRDVTVKCLDDTVRQVSSLYERGFARFPVGPGLDTRRMLQTDGLDHLIGQIDTIAQTYVEFVAQHGGATVNVGSEVESSKNRLRLMIEKIAG